MRDDCMEIGLALTLCGIGASFLLTAFLLYFITNRKRKSCTAQTQALVTAIQVRVTKDHSRYYHPIYEYTVDGVQYQGRGTADSRHTPKVNASITVQYNPQKPQSSYIADYDDRVWRILTLVFGIIGWIPIVICLLIALLAS